MGLTTILTTIWVCAPKFALVQNPYFQGKLDDYGRCWTRCRCLGVKSHASLTLRPSRSGAIVSIACRSLVLWRTFTVALPTESPGYLIDVESADRQAAPASLGIYDGNAPSGRRPYPQVVAYGDGLVLRLAS